MSTAASARQLSLTDFQRKETRRKQRATYTTVEEYLSSLVESRLTREVYDNREVRKIARICGLHSEEVRTDLKRCGYEKIVNPNGLAVWIRKEEAGHEA